MIKPGDRVKITENLTLLEQCKIDSSYAKKLVGTITTVDRVAPYGIVIAEGWHLRNNCFCRINNQFTFSFAEEI